jgi:RNA polymerase sigma-70 factor (ECF subfamily)
MSGIFEEANNLAGFGVVVKAPATVSASVYKDIYEQNHRRIYALAFWMTDNELAAEQLMEWTFERAFSCRSLDPESIDRALLAELRDLMPIGSLTISCATSTQVAGVRRNTMRVHLERAVVQLPPTERMVFLLHDMEAYDHTRIARTLGITEEESMNGLHQARLRIRELLATMTSK